MAPEASPVLIFNRLLGDPDGLLEVLSAAALVLVVVAAVDLFLEEKRLLNPLRPPTPPFFFDGLLDGLDTILLLLLLALPKEDVGESKSKFGMGSGKSNTNESAIVCFVVLSIVGAALLIC